MPIELENPAPDKITVLFSRWANYAGGGRNHVLKLDDRQIGELTADNYYHIELWPGEYQFTVYLPPESFLGQTNPPMNFNERVGFNSDDAGCVFLYQFTDGQGNRGFELRRMTMPPTGLSGRRLAASLTARDTAQVTHFFSTRYDGPAINGKPHGNGTLTWPDGAVYQGLFNHGVATNRARFFFPNGLIFMGSFYKGRPKSPGVLMRPGGRILFAGGFVDEKPHGIGLRYGDQSPEFCVFDHGRDITKSSEELAKERLDAEDQAGIEAFSNRIEDISLQIKALNDRLSLFDTNNIADADDAGKRKAELEEQIRRLIQCRSRMESTAQSDLKNFIAELYSTRYQRELTEIKKLKKDHQAKIEEERIWCEEESTLGRNICSCAPLAADFDDWQQCTAPIGRRY